MSILLFDLKANRMMNHTPFVHHVKVYDTAMVYEKRKLFGRLETTISYNHVSQVNLINEIFFSHLEIINTGGVENIFIKYLKKRDAKKAKAIIDQKIHRVHGVGYLSDSSGTQDGSQKVNTGPKEIKSTKDTERALNRLEELVQRGRLSKKEYNKKRSQMLKT